MNKFFIMFEKENTMAAKRFSLILNGKKAGIPEIRTAVYSLREQGYDLAVKVTWEGADMERLIQESINAGFDRIIVGGGDGSLNEAVTALMHLQPQHKEAPALITRNCRITTWNSQ